VKSPRRPLRFSSVGKEDEKVEAEEALRLRCSSPIIPDISLQTNTYYKIWGPHSSAAEDSSLRRYDIVSSSKLFLVFKRIVVPTPSALNSPRRMPDPEVEFIMTLQNIRNHSPNNKPPYFRRPKSSNAHYIFLPHNHSDIHSFV
jgi:hypothetical protein